MMGLPVEWRSKMPVLPDDALGFQGRDLSDEEMAELEEIRFPVGRAYLRAYAWTGRKGKAQMLAGTTKRNTSYWRNACPVFRRIEEELAEEVRERANEFSMDLVEQGFEDRLYTVDKNGNKVLKHVRERRDPGFTKAWMASIDPAWRPNEGAQQAIVVNIIQVEE